MCLSAPTFAASEILALFDLDNNPATGCSVPTVDGQFDGVESVIVTTIQTASPSTVSGVARRICSGGTLVDDPSFTPVNPPSWPVGMDNGPDGTDVVETYAWLGPLLPDQRIRVGFLSRLVGGTADQADAFILADGQAIILAVPPPPAIPTLGTVAALLLSLALAGTLYVYRRRLASRGMAFVVLLVCAGWVLAMVQITRDGLIGDWVSISPSWTDAASDGPPNTDIRSIYVNFGQGYFDFRFDMDIQPDQAPTVMSTNPVDGAASVSGDGDLTITFSEPVTLSGDWFQIACSVSGVRQAADALVTGGPETFTIAPTVPFTQGETCTVTIAHAQVTDQDDIDPPDTMASDHVFTFTVDGAPAVTANTPAANAVGVAGNTPITVTFNEAVNVGANAFTLDCGGSSQALTVAPAAPGGVATYTLTPVAAMPAGELCTVTVHAAEVSDVDTVDAPDHPVADHVFAFTIDQAPSVTASVPAANATGVALNANVVLSFSEPVTVSGNWFQIACPSGNRTPANSTVSGGGTATLTINPTTDFTESEHCTVTVYASLVADVDSADPPDSMAADHVFSFDVAAVNNPPSFTKGADQTVLEDAGLQTVNNWATAISAGPPHESGQTVSFNVTGNTNPSLFSAGPAVASNGTLTYTPAANANGSATLTLVAQDDAGGNDTSAPQTFTITVTAVNDAPVFTKGADPTVLENAGAQTLVGWATAIGPGAANESAQTVSFNVTGNTNPGLFSVAPSVAANGTLTFTPVADANGSATLTLVAQDNGGTANGGVDTSPAQTFTITVTAVNDAPSFTKGGDQSVAEDAGAQSVAGWATAISAGPADESGQTVSFNVTGNTNPGLFSAGPAVASNGTLTYTPAANANGSATLTLVAQDNGGTANGGVDTSAAQTFVISVSPVNDAPSFTVGADQNVLENVGAQSIPGWATAISAGPADEVGQTVSFTITGNTNPGLFSVAPAVAANGTLTFTPATNTSGSATLTLTLQDNGGGSDTSAPQSFTISVTAVNDPPSFTAGADQSVLEDAGAQTVAGWATAISPGPADEAGQTVVFNVTGNTTPSLFSAGPAVASDGTLTFTPAANAFGSADITIELQDDGGTASGGDDTSASQTFTIALTAVNDEPSFTKGADDTVLENAGAQTVSGWATAISAGPGESGQTVTFNVTGNTNPGLFSAGPAVASDGTLTYTPTADVSGSATITLELSDDGGTANGGDDTSAAQTFTITVTGVNNAPAFTKGSDVTVDEDSGPQTVSGWATGISAGPADESGQTLTFNVTNNTNSGLFSAGPVVAANGTLTFTPAANAYGSATITLNLSDDGGTANGGDDTSADQTFVITVNPLPDAPTVAAKSYETIPNVVLEVAAAQTKTPGIFVSGNLLTGASDPEGGSLTVTGVSGLSADAVVNYNADGTFTYLAPPGRTTADTFSYTATSSASGLSASGLVTVTFQGGKTWFVKNDATAGGKGRSEDPFDTLAEAETASAAGDIIYVYYGDGTTTGQNAGIDLKSNQRLISERVQLEMPVSVNGGANPTVLLLAGSNRPKIDNTSAGAGVGLANVVGVEVRGLDLAGDTNAVSIANTSATGSVTLHDNIVSDAGLEGVKVTVSGGTLTLDADGNSLTATGNAFDARTSGGDLRLKFNNHTNITSTSGAGVYLSGAATDKLIVTGFANNSVHGNTAGTGVYASTVTFDATPGGNLDTVSAGALAVGASGNGVGGAGVNMSAIKGDLQFGNLDVYADNGNAVALSGTGVLAASSGTRLRATSGNLVATGGASLDASNATLSLPMSVMSSTNSAGRGISIAGGTGNVSATSGSLANATGYGIYLDGGDTALTYPGSVSHSNATEVLYAQNRTGGLVVLSGTIGSTGKGIYLSGNPSTTFNLSGPVSLSTGLNTAFDVRGAGTVNVSNATSTITTSTGTGFNINGTGGGGDSVTYAGTITVNSAGRPVSVASKTGGTVAFQGAVSGTNSSTGVSLTTNTGATVRFSGGLLLSTGSNAAFTATGGGTVEVCDENPCNPSATGALVNTLTSTTGTALNVTSTTIGANNLEFRSISASGGNNGIYLSSTGSSGGLKVKGNGSPASGGTIANMNGGADNTSNGVGIYLSDTSNVSLARMQLNGFSNHAIKGSNVTGFTLADSTINGTNGNNGTYNEGSVSFSNLLGSASVSNTAISGGFEDNFRLVNDSGTLNRITFDNVNIGANSTTDGNDGIIVEANGTAVANVTVQNSTFTSAAGDLFQLNVINTGSSDLIFTNNTLSNDHAAIATGGGGVTISAGSDQAGVNLTYNISGNTFRDAVGHAILLVKSTDAGTVKGTFSNNTVGSTTTDTGSAEGDGIKVQNAGKGVMTGLLQNNQFRHHNNMGMEFLTGGGASAMSGGFDMTVTGNSVKSNDATDGLPWNGIHLNGGTVVGDTYAICMDIGGAGGLSNDPVGSGINAATDIRVRQRQSTTVRLPGYVGAATDTAAVQAFLTGRNQSATASASYNSGGFSGGAACAQP